MSFSVDSNIAYVEYPALAMGRGPIPMDGSALQEVSYQLQTTTAPVVGISGEPNNFNNVEALFDINISANNRVLFDKSYLHIEGFACDMRVGVTTPIATGATSIPWNSLAALFATAEVKLNNGAVTTEQITQNLGDGSMAKFLTKYSPDMLENMSDSLFTPCLEEERDVLYVVPTPAPKMFKNYDVKEKEIVITNTPTTNTAPQKGLLPKSSGWVYPSATTFTPNATTGMSPTSQYRAHTQLVQNSLPLMHAKNIYLCDLFDSLRLPAAFYVQNVQLKFRPKPATDILFTDTAALIGGSALPLGYNPKYFVTRMTLFLTQVTLSEDQLRRESEKIKENASVLRESFFSYDAVQKTHSQSASYRDSNIKNMQAAIFMFPSSTAADGIGINRYQYTYGCAIGDMAHPSNTTGIVSYQHKYDSKNSPNNYLAISPATPAYNTDVFAQYRMLCRKMSDRESPITVNFFYGYGGYNSVYDQLDHSNYVMFCAPFFPLTTHGHQLMAGADHEIITSGGGTQPIVIVRIRLSFMEIRGDTQVYMIN